MMDSTLFKFIKGGKGLVIASLVLSTLTILSIIGLMGASAYLIVMAGFHPSVAALQVAIVGVRFFGISRSVFRYVERLVSHSTNLKILSNIRQFVFRQISKNFPFSLPGKSSASILGFLIQDIEMLENVFVRLLLPVASSFLVMIFVSIFLGILSPELVGVALLGFAVCGLILPWISARSGRKFSNRQAAFRNEYQESLLEFFQFFQESLIFYKNREIVKKISGKEEKYNNVQLKSGILQALFSSVNSLFIQLIAVFCLWLSLKLLIHNQTELILIAVFYLILLTMFEPLQNLPTSAFSFGNIKAILTHIEQVAIEPNITLAGRKADLAGLFPIQIQNLSFRYPQNGIESLKNINLNLHAKERIAVVGRNGSGKTTFLDLLSGFYNKYVGRVLIGGHELRNLDLVAYRNHLGNFQASPYIFAASLRQNLEIANPACTSGQISEVIDQVGLVSRFSPGTDELISEKGMNISAGEKQRIELARILLRNNDLLLLDEPLSNLDPMLASRFCKILQAEFSEKTVIWVTHQLLNMEWFDQILVFENGEIVERGHHRELIENKGAYFELFTNKSFL
jgi:ATP-binding cassette subfamily C protein CydC